MKHLIAAFAIAFAYTPLTMTAQTMPPVPGNDYLRDSYGLWKNTGWVINTQGDLQPDVQFVTEGAYPRAYIRRDAEISFVISAVDTSIGTLDTLRRLDLSFIGEMAHQPDALGSSGKDFYQNFYLPHCGPEGKTFVPGYNRVVYESLYDDIDLWFFSGQLGQKMMFVVRPGGDPNEITMRFQGQDDMDVDVNGWLRLQMSDKWIVLPEAVAYQYVGNTIIPVNWTPEFLTNSGSDNVGLSFDEYDPTKPLVLLIGPPPPFMGGGGAYEEEGLCWSTYCGGGNEEYSVEMAVDNDDNMFLGGVTTSTIESFPTATGLSFYLGGVVSYILKFDTQNQLQWKLFYGGSAGEFCRATSCVLAGTPTNGGVYIAGRTNSDQLQNYLLNGGHNYTSNSGTFIAKFDVGSGIRKWATYWEGGTVKLASSGTAGNSRIYLSGGTFNYGIDASYLDVPPPPGSTYWAPNELIGEGYVAMLDPDDMLAWWTYIPTGYTGNVYWPWWDSEIVATQAGCVVSGMSGYPDIPVLGGNALAGEQDAVILQFNANCQHTWGTYFGESGSVFCSNAEGFVPTHLLAIDKYNTQDLVIAGYVEPGTVPMEEGPGWHSGTQTWPSHTSFIARFSGDDHSLLWCTYLPGTASTFPEIRSVYFDKAGNLYVSGGTRGITIGFPTLPGYYHQTTLNPNEAQVQDGFLLVTGPNDFSLDHVTLYGGFAAAAHPEHINTLSERNGGRIDFAGATSKGLDQASYFPLDDGGGTPSFWPTWAGGNTDGFVATLCSELPTATNTWPLLVSSNHLARTGTNLFALPGLPVGLSLVQVFDATGRLLKSVPVSGGGAYSTPVDVSDLAPGLLLLKCGDHTYRAVRP